MKDIELAKELLVNEKLTFVAVKDGNIIYKSNNRGIKPLYTAYREIKEDLKDSSIADKVIGMGAAMICIEGGVYEIHTELISEKAVEMLNEKDIIVNYNHKSKFIRNRENNGMCPVEKYSLKSKNIDELFLYIEKFLPSTKAV